MFDFDDWGSWGIGDFYNGNEEELRKAIESGEPFDTGWHGYKKELQSMRVIRDENGIEVSVYAYMDEALEQTELFDDFLEYDEWDLLTDEKLEEIRDYLCWGDFVEETEDSFTFPNGATFDEVMKKAHELADYCDKRLQDSFLECIDVTLAVIYNDPEDKSGKIAERINKYK